MVCIIADLVVCLVGAKCICVAFRREMRRKVVPNPEDTNPSVFEEKVRLSREIADVLRKNIVQARKVDAPSADRDRYRASHPSPICVT